jgi:aminoglycoside phosphotransferase (APT) family kinase protein
MSTAPVFPLVGPGHPFERGLEAFRARLASDARLAGARGESEVKAVREADGAWAIDRVYAFVPRSSDGGFGGALLHARGGEPEVHEFPHDPRLPALAAPGSPLLGDGHGEVLRYVPLRRLTFVAPGENGRALIGKFKRPSTLDGAYRRLEAAWRAARGASFGVPRPAGVDTSSSVFYQEHAAGADAATLVDAGTLKTVMGTVGRVHRELHALPVADAPPWDLGRYLVDVERDLQWIAFMVPGSNRRLARVAARLAARVPDPAGAERAFCHGDFVVSQLLLDGGRVTALDFDLAAIGDPYRDIAMLIASLPFDVPYLGAAPAAEVERARDAYLSAYAERAGTPIDARRLAWYRVCAAIYHVAMRIRKGRSDRPEVDRALDELETLCRRMR